jgi:hypothetical protein
MKPKRGAIVKPILSLELNSRYQIGLIEMQSHKLYCSLSGPSNKSHSTKELKSQKTACNPLNSPPFLLLSYVFSFTFTTPVPSEFDTPMKLVRLNKMSLNETYTKVCIGT